MSLSRKKNEEEICMAGGGLVPDLGDVPIPGSPFDVGNGGSTTFRTNGAIPPPPPMAMLPQAPQMPPSVPPNVPHETMPAMPAPSGAPQGPIPGLSDILAQARGAGGQLYGQYTPEMRNQLYSALLERRNGMGGGIANGLALAGDAIARGYGRSQSNFLDKSIEQGDKGVQGGLDAFDAAQKGTLGMTAAGMDVQKMDPNSAISKLSREAYAPLLGKLGYSPEALTHMSGANVETVAKIAAEYGGKEMENLFRQAQLIVENANQKATLGLKQEEIQSNRLKEKVEHPILSALPTAANKQADQIAGLGGAPGATAAPLFAKNAQGHRIMSSDGGHSWTEAK